MAENAACTMYLELNGQIPLESGHVYLMGKDLSTTKDNDKFINLKDVDDVDQKHCILEVGVRDVYIFDLFSSKGTYLNNERLKPLERLPLKNGDEFKVGVKKVKFVHERPDMSHDSSGFLEVNKNTSDMVASSPESVSQREIRKKRLNNNNFIVPALPAQKLSTPNTSLFIPETEANFSLKVSLNGSVNDSRKSDSFTIPETQYCKPRDSINTSSNLSVAESIPDNNLSKNKFDFSLNDDDDEFCIPETQDVFEEVLSCSQRPRLLTDNNKPKEKNILEERSIDLNEEDDSLNASQFRICTQDYNEGFGEEADSLISQIIPIIKHDIILLNNTRTNTRNESNIDTSKLAAEDDKEMSAIKWTSHNTDQDATNIRDDCPTPDIFDFGNIRDVATSPNKTKKQTELSKESDTNKTLLEATPPVLEDEEDLMPTQVFPSINSKATATERKSHNEKEQPCLEQEKEYTLTLSDKENRRPGELEPITDLPPTQLFSRNDGFSSASTSSCKSTASKSEASLNLNPSTSAAALINNLKHLPNFDLDDEEDDLLTQAFLQPSKPPLKTTTTKTTQPPENNFNSTLLDGKMLNKNPATFFAEMEKTPLKQNTTPLTVKTFKMPEFESSSLKKNSSAASTTSESDLDLLMCTPQLIKEHLQVSKNDDLKRSLLATKHKNLFGDETDEEADEDDGKKKETYLVELINVPKDTKDFDKLLPHLKNKQNRTKRKSTLSEEQKVAREAYKDYKFNISFGQDQESNKSMNTSEKSSSLSRDERHAARDKEREHAQIIVKHKKKEEKAAKEESSRKTKTAVEKEATKPTVEKEATKPTVEKEATKRTVEKEATKRTVEKEANKPTVEKEATKPEKPTKSRKVEQSSETTSTTKNKKSKTTKTEKLSVEKEENKMPARRVTRLKSRLEEKPSTSNEALAKEKLNENTDDLDSISTQPFVRSTRSRSISKQGESQDSVASKRSAPKTVNPKKQQNNVSKNNSSTSHNSSLNDSAKTSAERKRKAETHTQQGTTERKRLRSTSSLDISTPQSSTASAYSSSSILISMTMVEPQLFKELAKNSAGLWCVASNPAESKILVMDKAFRTFKFFLAMARGIPIVNSNWLKKVNEAKSLKKVTINDYLFSDVLFEKKHKFSLKKSLSLASSKRLFEGYDFLMTPGIVPNTTEIKDIIEVAGGNIHLKTPPPARNDQKIYLISCVNDKKHWHTFRRLNKNIVIISTEAIMSAVMRQSCSPLSSQNNVLA